MSTLGSANSARISVNAQNLTLSDGAKISAESLGNVPAGDIFITVSGEMTLDNARITTNSNQADGGDIAIDADRVVLSNGVITTSVEGSSPGLAGGDIRLRARELILDTGFIQANSNSSGGSGGDILVEVDTLISSKGLLLIDGEDRLTFVPGVEGLNVIQAVAPDGVSGSVNIPSLNLDISGTLVPLRSDYLDIAALIDRPCDDGSQGGFSSLRVGGRGGPPTSPTDPQSLPFAADRLDRLLGTASGSDAESIEASSTRAMAAPGAAFLGLRPTDGRCKRPMLP